MPNEVKLAIQGLQAACNTVLCKYEKRRRKKASLPAVTASQLQELDRITAHMKHCLTTLTAKQKSLQTGLQQLERVILPALLQRHDSAAQTSLSVRMLSADLEHFFGLLLRLHDGLILLVSGECRHAGDTCLHQRGNNSCNSSSSSNNSSNRHASRLSAATRTDGYTRLYSATAVYTGASWDEFMDPTVGLQHQLVVLLKPWVVPQNRDSLWDVTLAEHGAAGLEGILSQTEVRMQQVQQTFVSLSAKITTQLTVTLQKRYSNAVVQLQLADKLESLRVTAGSHCVRLERRAKAFQVADANGVLPIYNAEHWINCMQFSPLSSATFVAVGAAKRKRRVIQDSDDSNDDDDDDNGKPPASKPRVIVKKTCSSDSNRDNKGRKADAGGLVVRVQSRQQKDANETSSSVREIKQQMGVDVDGWAAALDGLEAEEAGASRAAAVIDTAPVDVLLNAGGGEDDQYEIQQAECRVKRRKSVLKKVAARDIPDDNDIWDAREGLREAVMAAGNSLLWTTALHGEKRPEELKKAIRYFAESKDLVVLQERLHARMTKETNDYSNDSRFYRRNLLLLRGQAHTNMGIAMIEMSMQLDERNRERKVYLREGTRELDKAQECAKAMQSQATMDQTEGSSALETELDVLRAQHVEALATRWSGTACWKQGRQKESVRLFERGATVLGVDQSSPNIHDEEMLDATLQLCAEFYYAWTTLADLASQALDRTPVSYHLEALAKNDEVLSIAIKALEGAATTSKRIQKIMGSSTIGGTFATFQTDHDVLGAEDLRRSRDEIREWWLRRKASLQPIQVSRDTHSLLPRSDIFPDGPHTTEAMPTRRFVVSDDSWRRKRKKKDGTGTYCHVNLLTSGRDFSGFNDQMPSRPRQPRQFRKWGDQLLPQETNDAGKVVPALPYPSVAPEIPPYIAAILERRQLLA